MYRFGEGLSDATLPTLLARANFMSIVSFPSLADATGFLADEGWHALCFDCVQAGAVLHVVHEAAATSGWMASLIPHGWWTGLFGERHEPASPRQTAHDPAVSDNSSAAAPDVDRKAPAVDVNPPQPASSPPTASSLKQAAVNPNHLAHMHAQMEAALLRDGPVLVVQVSADDSGKLCPVPDATEVCTFRLACALNLDGGDIPLSKPSPRLRLVRCGSLASVVLHAAHDPHPSSELIPTRLVLSKL